MKVWVVTWHLDYQCGEADAVFTTEALAQEYVAATEAEASTYVDRFEINEFVVRDTLDKFEFGDTEAKKC